MTRIEIAMTLMSVALAVTGCEPSAERADVGARGAPPVPVHQPATHQGMATLHSKIDDRSVQGTVRFEQSSEGVTVDVRISGLTPGSVHGIHVHEHGDCSAPDASSAGEHFAPHGHEHALPPVRPRHDGDMGNMEADDRGYIIARRTFDTLSLTDHERSIIGRAVIVHAGVDHGIPPAGDAGERIACGVIGLTDAEG